MARLFNDANLEFLRSATPPVTNGPLTFNAWFNSDDDTVNQTVMGIFVDGVSNMYMRLAAMGAVAGKPVRYQASNAGGTTTINTSTGFTANGWNMATATTGTGGTPHNVWLNAGGNGNNATVRVLAGVDRFTVGVMDLPAIQQYMSGRIAQVAVWNVDLPLADIERLYAGGVALPAWTIRPDALVWYSQLLDNDGDINERQGPSQGFTTIGGTPTWGEHVPLILDNIPFPRTIKAPVAGATQIAGTSSATVSTSGVLAVSARQLAGTTSATLSTSGALAIAARAMAGTTSAVVSSSGAFAVSARLLAGTTEAIVSSSGALSSLAVDIAGTAEAVVSTAGNFAVTPRAVSGVSTGVISTAGALTSSVLQISGAAAATVSTSGVFVGVVQIAGVTEATISTAGVVTTGVTQLAGTTDAILSTSGVLTVAPRTVAGSTVATVSTSGLWVLVRQIAGTSAATISTSGQIGQLVLDPRASRTCALPESSRVCAIAAESRLQTIP